MATLFHRVNDDGDHQVIVEIEGAIVPLLTVPAYVVDSRIENANNRGDTVKAAKAATDKGGEK